MECSKLITFQENGGWVRVTLSLLDGWLDKERFNMKEEIGECPRQMKYRKRKNERERDLRSNYWVGLDARITNGYSGDEDQPFQIYAEGSCRR